jgi:hypothetical protein
MSRAVQRLLLAAALAAALAGGAALPGLGQETRGAAAAITQEHASGPVHLTLAADRRSMPIDGRLRLTLLVEAPARSILSFPEVTAHLGPFAVAGQSALGPSSTGGGRALWRRELILEAEGVGELTLPALTVTVQDEAAAAADLRQITTDPVTVTVTSVVPPDADLSEPRDIAPPVPLPRAGAGWLAWLLGAVILMLAGLALALQRRRRQVPTAASRPAHLLALAELERLQADADAGRAAAEELYPGLADLLRRYVVARFGLQAEARTTEELLAAAAPAAAPIAGLRDLIGPVLATCDLVKFARHRPGPDDLPIQLRQTRAFIEQTADD